MINLNNKTIELDGKIEPIKEIICWFKTPFGLISSLDEAIQKMKEFDLDPMMTIIPIPVFKGETLTEVKI